jgi:hypothetical protein
MAALTPQQEALRTVRDRFERGAIDYDTFRDAFEALLKTDDPAECQRILDALPTAASTDVLAALDRTSAPVVPVRPAGPSLPRTRRFFTLLGEINRSKHPWKMGEHTSGVALMGEINLDLTLAALPARGVLNVWLLMGEVRIIVPDNVAVTVHAFTFMGETRALNEHSAGIFAFAQDDDERANAPHHLDIHVFLLMGEIRIQRSGANTTLPAHA